MSRKHTAGAWCSVVRSPAAGERAFEVVDDVLEPGVLLVTVIEGQERLIQQGSDLHSPLGGEIQDLAFADSGLDQRPLELCSPPVRLGLGNPPQAVAVDAQPPLNHRCLEPPPKLPLDQLGDASLVLADMVVRIGLGEADRFTNDHGQLQRDAGLRAQPPEGRRRAS
jgi:hypothetical protein